jgi:hypothetical protein
LLAQFAFDTSARRDNRSDVTQQSGGRRPEHTPWRVTSAQPGDIPFGPRSGDLDQHWTPSPLRDQHCRNDLE